MNRNILHALLAALLFGASTPLAKLVIGDYSPFLMAGLLYLGSGIGVILIRVLRDRGWQPAALTMSEWGWFSGAIFFGGLLGPVALLFGLGYTDGSTASLLLNLEAVLTALIAWVIFKENAGRRIVVGMGAITAGGVVLSWPEAGAGFSNAIGPLAVVLASLCWAIDNNMTRRISATDALFIAGVKGAVAGGVNCLLALSLGGSFPSGDLVLSTLLIGLFGYGISLVSFVLALRGLGAARTGAYFSTAPFIGAAVALVLLDEATGPSFWIAAGLMGAGVWLHLTEHHEHEHRHEPLEHRHNHAHDEHHRHAHDDSWDGAEPHDHWHIHEAIVHKHPHFPDIHHHHTH